MAYLTHLKPDGTYQPLKAHEENVATLAGKFAEAFGAKAHGERTGLLHDIGKYSDNGQKRQRDPEHTAQVDHATAGTQLAWKLKTVLRRLPWRAITAVCRIWAAGLMTAAERFGRG